MLFDFAMFFNQKASWSKKEFGDSYDGVIKHLRREVEEAAKNPSDLEEWVDVVNMAMDGAMRHAGADGEAFVAALLAKHQKNINRTWKKDSEGVASHVGDEERMVGSIHAPGCTKENLITSMDSSMFINANAFSKMELRDLHDDDGQEASTPDREPSKALVLRWLGVTVIMDWEGLDLIDEAKVVGELHILDDAGNPPGDGLWVYECSRVDAGASDWGQGLRDTAIEGTWRAPTVAEVEYFKEWHT